MNSGKSDSESQGSSFDKNCIKASEPYSTGVVNMSFDNSAQPQEACSSSVTGQEDPGPSCSTHLSDSVNSASSPLCYSNLEDIELSSYIDFMSSSEEREYEKARKKFDKELVSVMSRITTFKVNKATKDKIRSNPNLSPNSSDSEYAYNEDLDIASRLRCFDLLTMPYHKKKKKHADRDENMVHSDDADCSSCESETNDEELAKKHHQRMKAKIKDILKTGYERTRKKEDHIFSEGHGNSFKIYKDEHPILPEEDPTFDNEGRAKINQKHADDFQRFVFFDLPNIPSDEEDNLEKDPSFKKWAADLDKKSELLEKEKLHADKKCKKADSCDKSNSGSYTSKRETKLTKKAKHSKRDEYSTNQMPEQTEVKKAPCVPTSEIVPEKEVVPSQKMDLSD